MLKQRRLTRNLGLAMVTTLVAAFGVTGYASAHTGEWAAFNGCPSTTKGVFKCLQSVTGGGKVVLGSKNVPIVNPVTLQGGVSEAVEQPNGELISSFFGASNGETLSKTPQPVPGGLSGLVNCKEISLGWLRASCEAIFENGLTGVNATLELARPANEIVVSELNLLAREGTALLLPVKVHLENPLFGSSCYVGSSSTPLVWNLTTGTTTPPAGFTALTGKSGKISTTEGGQILTLTGNKLVENNWSAPGASGCGGWPAEYILDPIVNASVGIPSSAGKNEAVLENTIKLALASEVNKH